MAWIKLPGLLGFMYKRKIFKVIGSTIGKVAKFDFKTDNRTRGRFARMAVFINLDKPLDSQIHINGDIQWVEYKALPTICFASGKYGHVSEMCSLSKEASSKEGDKSMANSGSSKNNGELGKETELAFRPWMLVERRSRFDALTNKGEMVGGERKMAKEDNGGFNSHAVELDLVTPNSRDKGFFKPLPNSHIGSTKGVGLNSKAQKRTSNIAAMHMGGGFQLGQGMDRLKVKSLEKKVMHRAGSNRSLGGPQTKTNPINLYSQDCPIEAYQTVSYASLKLGVVGSHKNGSVGKKDSPMVLSKPVSDQ
ncbi:hypothetical protein J1N35_029889 [Gossypium stocksii]|uniref:DUF4283 domain-containing protein n=1 Tax=Gossypium stocksii TaxID=47602 RepID=A0A9D3UZK7_9ROSI|nr:hypothetical protein J1N35_029889 [Gossypium stocksii]